MKFENGVDNENGISIETILENKHESKSECKVYKLNSQEIKHWTN